MNPILERLLALMEERDFNARQATTERKMSASSFTGWKNGKALVRKWVGEASKAPESVL